MIARYILNTKEVPSKVLVILLLHLLTFNFGHTQNRLPTRFQGLLELKTTSFKNPSLAAWVSSSKATSNGKRLWGENSKLQRLLFSTTENESKFDKGFLQKVNFLADNQGILGFNYYTEHDESVFNNPRQVAQLRSEITQFIRSESGLVYNGQFLLIISTVNEEGTLVFMEAKDSGVIEDFVMDVVSLRKKSWLDEAIKKQQLPISSQKLLLELEKFTLPREEKENEQAMVIDFSKGAGEIGINHSKFDVAYGRLKNLKWGGLFMEAIERGDLSIYSKQVTKLSRSLRKTLKENKKDIVSIQGNNNKKAPIFTSILHNPAQNWYERTYYEIDPEVGLTILLQIQLIFEEESENGAIKHIIFKRDEKANKRFYCQNVLFVEKNQMPFAPVYEMDIDWKQKRIKENK